MECEQSHKTFVARQYKYVWGAFFDFEKPSEVLLKFASFFISRPTGLCVKMARRQSRLLPPLAPKM